MYKNHSSRPATNRLDREADTLEWRPGKQPFASNQAPNHMSRRSNDGPQAHILVAESDVFHRRILRMLLASPQITMMEVTDGQAAIDLMSIRRFDLLLLDTEMPRLNGPDTLRWIRKNYKVCSDIPVLGLVDDTDRSMIKKMGAAGMDDWIAKPVSRIDLMEKITRVLPALNKADF